MFRPCIDLHEGQVKQIVGRTLGGDPAALQTNFTADRPGSYYAALYRQDRLPGGHVIMLGPGNEEAARETLAAYPGGLQLGGGITAANARGWIERGASHVIVTSWVFPEGRFAPQRLQALVAAVGRDRLVLDLSCRRHHDRYRVVRDGWRQFAELDLSAETLEQLSPHCAEFLIHAVDVEGSCEGIDLELVSRLADWAPIPATYAGGARTLRDLEEVTRIGRDRIDLTIGSALDIFGGSGVRYQDAVAFNHSRERARAAAATPEASPSS